MLSEEGEPGLHPQPRERGFVVPSHVQAGQWHLRLQWQELRACVLWSGCSGERGLPGALSSSD